MTKVFEERRSPVNEKKNSIPEKRKRYLTHLTANSLSSGFKKER